MHCKSKLRRRSGHPLEVERLEDRCLLHGMVGPGILPSSLPGGGVELAPPVHAVAGPSPTLAVAAPAAISCANGFSGGSNPFTAGTAGRFDYIRDGGPSAPDPFASLSGQGPGSTAPPWGRAGAAGPRSPTTLPPSEGGPRPAPPDPDGNEIVGTVALGTANQPASQGTILAAIASLVFIQGESHLLSANAGGTVATLPSTPAAAPASSLPMEAWPGTTYFRDLGAGVAGPPEPASLDMAAPDSAAQDAVFQAGLTAGPQSAGLLTAGLSAGIANLERAVRAMVEPLSCGQSEPYDRLYWLAACSWLLAAALAGEAARRLPRRRVWWLGLDTSPANAGEEENP